jgi:CRP-like cAMP-binding protein
MPLDNDQIQRFRANYLFEALTDEELKRVAERGSVVDVSAGETVFSQGDPCHHFYVVEWGMIKLYRVSADGSEKVMELVGPNQSFAEAVMFVGRYPLYAAALEPARLFAFDCKDFMAQLRTNVETCFRLMAGMSRRLHGLINEIDHLTLHSGTQRLIQYLLEQMPEGVKQSPCVRLLVPKLVIASRLGIKPETFSRILAKLRSDGLIEIQNDTIVLKDPGALRRLAETQG